MELIRKHIIYSFFVGLLFIGIGLQLADSYNSIVKNRIELSQTTEDLNTASSSDCVEFEMIENFKAPVFYFKCLEIKFLNTTTKIFNQYHFFHWQPPKTNI